MTQLNIKDTIENVGENYLVSIDNSLVAKFYTKDQIDDMTSETKYKR